MPGLYPEPQMNILRGLCITFPTLICIATGARLYLKSRQKWWWDDLFVVLGCMVMIEQQATMWAVSMYQPPTLPVSYVVVMSSYTQVWCARASILMSVLRIAPTDRSRLITKSVGGLFLLLWAIAIAQMIWVCQSGLKFVDGRPHCVITKQLPIYNITSAMIADTLLIILPIHTLRLLKGDARLRRRLRFIFAASAITTSASVTNAVMNFTDQEFGLFITAELECWVSLFVCNLGVLATSILRRISGKGSTTYSGSNSMPKTTTNGGRIEVSVVNFASVHDGVSQYEMGKIQRNDGALDEHGGDVKVQNSHLV